MRSDWGDNVRYPIPAYGFDGPEDFESVAPITDTDRLVALEKDLTTAYWDIRAAAVRLDARPESVGLEIAAGILEHSVGHHISKERP